jgi:hypothetical protein
MHHRAATDALLMLPRQEPERGALHVIFEGVYQTHMVLSCVRHLPRAAVTCDVLCCLQWTMLTVDSAVVHMGAGTSCTSCERMFVVVVTTIPGDSFNIEGNNPAVINDSQRQVWNVWAAACWH